MSGVIETKERDRKNNWWKWDVRGVNISKLNVLRLETFCKQYYLPLPFVWASKIVRSNPLTLAIFLVTHSHFVLFCLQCNSLLISSSPPLTFCPPFPLCYVMYFALADHYFCPLKSIPLFLFPFPLFYQFQDIIFHFSFWIHSDVLISLCG